MTVSQLGDLTQIPVTVNPTQGLPALGDVLVTLYNQDLTNLVWVSYQQWFKPGQGNSIPIQPLTSITISAKRAIYVGSTVAGVAALLVLPEGSQANPSPAQIAAQINALGLAKDTSVNAPAYGPATLTQQVTQQTAIPNNISTTGVPLLTLPQNLTNTTGTVVASGATTVIGTFSLSQIGYEITVSLWSAAGTATYARVFLDWIDSVTGTTVNRQTWWMIPGSDSTTNLHIIKGFGPSEANQVKISCSAYNNSVTFAQVLMNQNSRVFTRHDWRSWQVNTFAGGFGVSGQDLAGMILVNRLDGSVATNTHTTSYTGLFAGKVQIWAHSSSGAADCTVTVAAIADQTASLASPNNLAQWTTGGDGNLNVQWFAPRAQLQWLVNNGNAATKALSFSVEMADI